MITNRVAVFDKDRKYRYRLTFVWEPDRPLLNWIMLNPSTADEVTNDPTVERCERRARMWGYGGIIITNIFALRATDPQRLYIELLAHRDTNVITGNRRGNHVNNKHIMEAAFASEG